MLWCHRWWQVAGGKSADMPELELTVTYKLNISNLCRRGAVGTSWKSEVQRWHGTDRPSRVGPSAPCSPPSSGVPMLSSVLKTLIGFW